MQVSKVIEIASYRSDTDRNHHRLLAVCSAEQMAEEGASIVKELEVLLLAVVVAEQEVRHQAAVVVVRMVLKMAEVVEGQEVRRRGQVVLEQVMLEVEEPYQMAFERMEVESGASCQSVEVALAFRLYSRPAIQQA